MEQLITSELLLPLITAVFGIFKTIKFVQEGERGIKLRFGRAVLGKDGKPKIIEPGFVLLIPFVDTLKRRHVRQQTLRLADQKVMIDRGLIFNVSAIVVFRVKDVYKALFEIDDLDTSLSDLSMGILRDILASKSHTELSSMEKISEELLRELKEKAEEWGVEFMLFKLTDCAPTPETAPLVNAEAGVKLKMDALKGAAQELKIDVEDFSPVLAAALVGVPMVTTIAPEIHIRQKGADGRKKTLFRVDRSEEAEEA